MNQEEVANSITHGIGLILSLIGLGILIQIAFQFENNWLISSAMLYGGSAIILYGASTIYHSVKKGRLKALLQRIDHAAIYVFIAGTYTPFTLVLLRNESWWGWALFITIWLLAITGAIIKLRFMGRFKKLSLASYICMGWLALIAIQPLYDALSLSGMYWLLGGGIAYSLGAIFYKWEKLKFHHAIWHLFVIAGSACHYFCVLFYIYNTTA